MPVQKRGYFCAACGVLFCLMVLPGPLCTVTPPEIPDRVTHEATIPPHPAEAIVGYCGTSCLHPAQEEENEIILVDS